MDLILSFLLCILAALVLFVGGFLLLNRNRPFLIFHPENERGLRLFCVIFGGFMLFCGGLTIVALFISPVWFTLVIVIADALFSMIVPFVLWIYTL